MIVMANMPYAKLTMPSLAVGLINARLRQSGLGCAVYNFNFLFAEYIGINDYQIITSLGGSNIGEWLFAREAWPQGDLIQDNEFLEIAGIPLGISRDRLLEIRECIVPDFLAAAAARVLDTKHIRVVGFSCCYYQSTASFSLIRRIKQMRSGIKIVCGGSDFHAGMGRQRMKAIECIDAVSLGEADDVVVPLFSSLIQGREPEGLQGIVYRDGQGRMHEGPACMPVSSEVLESNPSPDCDEFFQDLSRLGLLDDPMYQDEMYNVIETSRGCWKGQKQHCTFCGVNNEGIVFRKMSTRRVVEHLTYLADRYPLKKFIVADNILPKKLFAELLPHLKKTALDGEIKFLTESNTTVSRQDVAQMSAAGVKWVIGGVESLSTSVLKCMRKGVTALKNIHFLKLCRTYGVFPLWKLLLRVPGETPADYHGMAAMIPLIVHFVPPCWPDRKVELHRFSPYFSHPERWVKNIRPKPFYRGLYPEDRVDINELAYFFDADWQDVLDGDAPYMEILEQIRTWMDAWRLSLGMRALIYEDLPSGGMRLTDTRRVDSTLDLQLDPLKAAVYKAIDDPVSSRRLADRFKDQPGGAQALNQILEGFVREETAIRENGQYLALAIPSSVPELDSPFKRR